VLAEAVFTGGLRYMTAGASAVAAEARHRRAPSKRRVKR
jgi:hypothetical protein